MSHDNEPTMTRHTYLELPRELRLMVYEFALDVDKARIHETKQVMVATLLSALSYGRLYSKYHALFITKLISWMRHVSFANWPWLRQTENLPISIYVSP